MESVNYIQVNSALVNNTHYHESSLYSLNPFSLEFTNTSSIVKIMFKDHSFVVGDNVVINNVVSKNVNLNNVLSVKKNSYFIRIHHPNHGLSLYGLYDPSDDDEFERTSYVDALNTVYTEYDDIPDMVQYYLLKKNSD